MFKKIDKIKVAVGLSGGVDSSVAALLLKQKGCEVTGVYMQCWDAKEDGCTSDEDRTSAVMVASKLGIKFKSLNFVKDYNKRVIDYFYQEYREGRTPNPDIVCNKEIKFGIFLDWAIKNGFDYVATGHYAGVIPGSGDSPTKLLKGVDASKDQSYFLYRLNQQQLSKTLFPLGELTKTEVREIAKEHDLGTQNRPDSQGICFIGKVDIKQFLMREIKPKTGKVFHINGEEIGTHDGVWFYTIGQRHGFSVNKYFGLPLYVVGKRVEKNELIVGHAKDVLQNKFNVSDLSWISGVCPKVLAHIGGKLLCDVRIRHLGELYSSEVIVNEDGILAVTMQEDSFGVAPGQSAVFYLGNEILGGGIIC